MYLDFKIDIIKSEHVEVLVYQEILHPLYCASKILHHTYLSVCTKCND